MEQFGCDYFSERYSDYHGQNPPRKLETYLSLLGRHAPGGLLLDVGCSYGLFVGVASRAYRCVGMDVDHGVVKKASEGVPRAAFVRAALPGVPFRDLDVVTALDVLEHVKPLGESLSSLWDSLRPGGVGLIVVPVYDGPLGWLVKSLDLDPTHVNRRSRQFWLGAIATRGFEVPEWVGIFRLFIGGKYIHFSTRRLRYIAPVLAVVVRRPR